MLLFFDFAGCVGDLYSWFFFVVYFFLGLLFCFVLLLFFVATGVMLVLFFGVGLLCWDVFSFVSFMSCCRFCL